MQDQNEVLFGIAHLLNHNETWLVRGLFEAEGNFYRFTPDGFRVSATDNADLVWPEKGDIIAFSAIEGDTPLRYVELGDEEVFTVNEILGVWKKTNSPLPKGLLITKSQSNDLINAVRSSNIDEVKTLLNNGADPNSVDEKGNPALLLSIGKNKEIAEALIIFGAQPDMTNAGEVSPFSFASQRHRDFLPILAKSDLQLMTISWLKKFGDQNDQSRS